MSGELSVIGPRSAPAWLGVAALACLLGVVACREREAGDDPRSGVELADGAGASGAGALPPLLPVRRLAGEADGGFPLAARMARFGVEAVSVASVEDGEPRGSWAAGRSPEGVPVTAATLFPGGAITDPLGAAMIGVAVLCWSAATGGELEAPIGSWVSSPAIEPSAQAPPPTVAQLLGHVGGLADDDPGTAGPPDGRLRALAAPRGVLPLVDRPGRRFRYSPAGVLLLRELLLARGGDRGDDLQDHLDELLLEPAGLRSTFVETPVQRLPGIVLAAPATDGAAVAADLWTTSSDLARLLAALIASARGVEPDTLLPWPLARRALTAGPGGFGWGFRIVEPGPRFELAVERDGLAVLAVGFVGSREGLVVMTAAGRGAWLSREILHGWAQARGWPGFEPETVAAAPTPSVALAVAGRYRLAEGDLVVEVEDGRLVVDAEPGVLGEEAVREPIYPREPLRYVFLERAESLTFVTRRGGGVRGVLLGERSGPRVDVP
ncbi:MAG TPA: serine hydrolase domain-containing protein [Thermoanaerobaculia bacterium]|nr:serine hydrolase domain-containing protein [Thermoanaerobaculia bacterium]